MKNIAIIGMPGIGKTRFGRAVATLLNYNFLDLDEDIKFHNPEKVMDEAFLAEDFRAEETRALFRACEKDDVVVVCGGGVIETPINVDTLKRHFVTILLEASPDYIADRITLQNSSHRPMFYGLTEEATKEKVRILLGRRRPLYENAADLRVDAERIGYEKEIP